MVSFHIVSVWSNIDFFREKSPMMLSLNSEALTYSTMKQQSICLFLAFNGLSARAVHDELNAVLGSDAITYSTVTKNLRQWSFPSILVDPARNHRRTLLIGQFIDVIEKQPFFSRVR
jgi:hypothetical protein